MVLSSCGISVAWFSKALVGFFTDVVAIPKLTYLFGRSSIYFIGAANSGFNYLYTFLSDLELSPLL